MSSRLAGMALSLAAAVALSFTLEAGFQPSLALAQETAPAQKKANIEMTTDPSPAQKGTNTVHVKLSDPSGPPILGAQVTVRFFMPAMPSMGMAAMTTIVTGTDRGGGMYEGKGDLTSGGIWQVTITARQNGQIIGSKKLTIKATGGM
jgi:nitrogen fixation protein FixH